MVIDMKIKDTEIRVIHDNITGLKVDAIVYETKKELAIKHLKTKHITHIATYSAEFKTNEIKVRSGCRDALASAERLLVKSIALPALGCLKGKFPVRASAKIMAQEILRHLRENNTKLKEIIICTDNKETCDVFNKDFFNYLDYIVNRLKSPFVTVDAIIEINKDSIVLIERTNPPFGWALPGGFVDYGESLEEAVIRETKEETGLNITNLEQFHTYSKPQRDPRFHTVATVFIVKAKGIPIAGDDAAGVKTVKLNEIRNLHFAFDHKKIIQDYLRHKQCSH